MISDAEQYRPGFFGQGGIQECRITDGIDNLNAKEVFIAPGARLNAQPERGTVESPVLTGGCAGINEDSIVSVHGRKEWSGSLFGGEVELEPRVVSDLVQIVAQPAKEGYDIGGIQSQLQADTSVVKA